MGNLYGSGSFEPLAWYISDHKRINVGNKIAVIFKSGGLDSVHCVSCAYLPYKVCTLYGIIIKSQLGL